jgi:hypothetical protein
MSVIGAAMGSGQLPGTSAPAAAAGSVAPAPGAVQATPAQLALEGTHQIDLVNADAIEIAGVHAAAGSHGMRVAVSNREITPGEVLRTLDAPVDTSGSARLSSLRDSLLADLRAGKGDLKSIVARLDGLSVLIEVTARQEEKRAFMKKLMKQLMLGILTPEMASMAKSLGLVNFLKEAIRTMVKAGYMSPNQIVAIAGIMADAKISMPVLDDMIIRNERRDQAVSNANRLARGQKPVAIASSNQAIAGTLLLSPAAAGTQVI